MCVKISRCGRTHGIRERAERRAGELLSEMKVRGERQKPGDNPRGVNSNDQLPLTPTLSDFGITGLVTAAPVLGTPAIGQRHACSCCNGAGVVPLPLDGAELLATIVRDYGSDYFTTNELMLHADIIDGPLRPLLAGYSARTIGKALAKLDGKAIDGRRLERLAMERNRVGLWRVACRFEQTDQVPSNPTATG